MRRVSRNSQSLAEGGKQLTYRHIDSGQYPDDLTPGGNYSDNRGRVVPTTSWEALWNAVAEWMDVHSDYISGANGVATSVLPNYAKFKGAGFDHLISKNSLFY